MDAIGEGFGAIVAQIAAEEREPRGEKLGGNSEFGGLVLNKERILLFESVEIVVIHGCTPS